MANAFQSLKSGIEADIKFMAKNNFMGVDQTVINEVYACMRLMKIGKNSFTPITWIEAWKLYGLHNYSKINAYLEKQLQPKMKTLINVNRGKSTDEKIDALEAYIAPAPVLLKRTEHAIQDVFSNEYSDKVCA